MKVKTLGTCVALLFAAFVHADIIVQPVSATQTGGAAPLNGSLTLTINGTGLTSPLTDDATVPGTLPTHEGTYGAGVRWLDANLPSNASLTFDLGGVQTDPVNSVILYNYNEVGSNADRGIRFVNVYTSSNGVDFSLFQTDLEFAQEATYPASGQVVDFASTISGASHIQFRNIRNFDGPQDGITGFDEIRFTAIPEPSTTMLLGMGGLVMYLRRRICK